MASFCSQLAAFAWKALWFGTVPYAMAGFIPSSAACAYVVATSRDIFVADNMVLSIPVVFVCTCFGPYSIPMLAAGFVGYTRSLRK